MADGRRGLRSRPAVVAAGCRLGRRFRVLLAAAHDRGLRVLLDGVFNHVGREFPAFVAAEAGGPEAAWFRRGQDGGWASFEGHEMLVDQRSPLVSDPGPDFWHPTGAAGDR